MLVGGNSYGCQNWPYPILGFYVGTICIASFQTEDAIGAETITENDKLNYRGRKL